METKNMKEIFEKMREVNKLVLFDIDKQIADLNVKADKLRKEIADSEKMMSAIEDFENKQSEKDNGNNK